MTDAAVTFTGTCYGGTSVVVTFDFGDGSPPIIMAMPLLSAWPPGLIQSQSHSYAYGGLYIAKVTIANGFEKYVFNHSLIVYGKIDNITLVTNSPVPFIGGMGIADLSFASPTPPANVQVLFSYGDGTLARVVTLTDVSAMLLMLKLHRVSKKNCANLFFAPSLSNMNRFQ